MISQTFYLHHISLCLLFSGSISFCSETMVRSFIKCSCGLFRTHKLPCCSHIINCALHCTALLHCSTDSLHSTTLHHTVQHCTALHCSTTLQNTALHSTVMKIIALHCTELSYPVLFIVLHWAVVTIFFAHFRNTRTAWGKYWNCRTLGPNGTQQLKRSPLRTQTKE